MNPPRRATLALLLGAGGAGLLAAWARGAGRTRPATAHPGHESLCFAAPALPYDPASGLPPRAARAVPAEARCPVCGMFPARRPEWAAQVIFADGAAQFLDSPASLATYLSRLPRYAPSRRPGEIVARYVGAADGAGWLRAERAWFVQAPGILGPMRTPNYLPFAAAAAAHAQAARLAGARVLDFEALLHAG